MEICWKGYRTNNTLFYFLQQNILTQDCCKLESNKTHVNMDCLQLLTIFKVMLHRSNQLCPRRQQTAVQQWKCTRGALPPTSCHDRLHHKAVIRG